MLTPAFIIAGLALTAVPIAIHLLNRRRYQVRPWAAMRFLLEAMKENRRRLRFERWILLATRCAAMLLLGLALSRPSGCGSGSLAAFGDRAGLHVIVLDNSYSTAVLGPQGTSLDRAKTAAKRVVASLAGGSESVAVVLASSPPTWLIAQPSYDVTGVERAIDAVPQSFGGTDVTAALRLAADVLDREANQPRRVVHLITDATRPAFPGNDDATALGRRIAGVARITHSDVGWDGATNAAVISLESDRALARRGFASRFTALPRGSGGEREFTWRVDEQPAGDASHVTPNSDDQPLSLDGLQFSDGGLHVVSAMLRPADSLPLDDTRLRVVDVAARAKVLLVEGRRAGGSLGGSAAYLQLALTPPEDADTAPSYLAAESASDLDLADRAMDDYRAIALADVAAVTPMLADRLGRYVRGGGALLIFAGEQIDRESYNTQLAPRGLLPGKLVRRVTASSGKPFTFAFDPSAPARPFLGAFRGLGNSGLTSAQVDQYWRIDLDSAVRPLRVLDYVAGDGVPPDPAITAHTLGEGTVIFYSTSANADWTSFPAKPAFVALMHELFAGAMRADDRALNLEVGQRLTVPLSIEGSGGVSLTDPAGRSVGLSREATTQPAVARPPLRSDVLARPGLYTLSAAGRNCPVAVNPPPGEADLTHLPLTAIRAALGDIAIEDADVAAATTETANDTARDFGWPLLASLGLLLLGESAMAHRFARPAARAS